MSGYLVFPVKAIFEANIACNSVLQGMNNENFWAQTFGSRAVYYRFDISYRGIHGTFWVGQRHWSQQD